MVTDRMFRHIPNDPPEFEMIAEKWNYLITMTAWIQNVIFSAAADIENELFHLNLSEQISKLFLTKVFLLVIIVRRNIRKQFHRVRCILALKSLSAY